MLLLLARLKNCPPIEAFLGSVTAAGLENRPNRCNVPITSPANNSTTTLGKLAPARGTTALSAAAKTLDHHRQKVRANQTRLAKGAARRPYRPERR
jgi:hypothetical protein